MEVGVKLGGGGGGRVGTIGVIEEDMGDGMQCSKHPYRNNPGGICAFCLQEKLGKLVSSSSPLPIHPFPSSSPGSSSPSFRSEANVGVSVHATNNGNNNNGSFGSTSSSSASKAKLGHEYDQFHIKRAKIPFLLTKKKKKTSVHGGSDRASSTVVTFKRSKSTVTPGRGRFLEDEESFSPRKRNGFWSFLSLSSSSRLNGHGGSNSMKKIDKEKDVTAVQEPKMVAPSNYNGPVCMKKKVEVLEDDSSVVARDPNCHVGAAVPSFERKVSRSRSVGCGSRSFSGDFFERISTGFGDCTLRRVESQREGKQKVTPSSSTAVYGGAGYDHHHHHIHHQHGQQFIKERVKCGGIFGGFMITSSSTSSICSSTYNWVNPSSNNEDVVAAKSSSSSGFGGGNGSSSNNNNGRNPTKSSWSWAFASPMRAFSKPSSSSSSKENGKKDVNKNTTNLDAIPSLLTVSS